MRRRVAPSGRQLQQRLNQDVRAFARQELARAGHDDPRSPGGEQLQVRLRPIRGEHPVHRLVQHDARHLDRWPFRQSTLDVQEAWQAGRQSVAVAIGVDNDRDEVRVVERGRGALEGRVGEPP